MRVIRSVSVVCCVLGAASAGASADVTLGFFSVTNNVVADATTGEQQLFVDVSDTGDHQVLFTFRNEGPLASSITDVYFDDGSLLGIASIKSDPGVEFSQLASPSDLPGGNGITPPFTTTAGFSADSDSPVQPNGVNPGEQLGIVFDLNGLNGSATFADVIDELTNGALRIGIHVQGFASGGSESFVNVPVVPLPGALALGTMGLGLVACFNRRRRG